MASQPFQMQGIMLIILIPLLILSQSFRTSSQKIGKTLIESTCNKTEYPEDCIAVLESDPRSFISNLTELTRIALEITTLRVNNSIPVADYWMTHAGDYRIWSMVKVCYSNYKFGVTAMKDSLEAFDGLKYDKAYQSVESLSNLVIDCQKYDLTFLNDLNSKMLRVVKDVMVIVHMLY